MLCRTGAIKLCRAVRAVLCRVMYDRASSLWTLLWKIVECHPRLKKLQGVFWSANQRFWKQMLMACKVPHCATMAREAVQDGMAVVIGLQSTGKPACPASLPASLCGQAPAATMPPMPPMPFSSS